MKRRRVRKIIIGILTIVVIYYGNILYSTHNVMEEICKATQEEKVVENDNSPLKMFYIHKDYYSIVNVARYYTWCWQGRGKIYLTYEVESLGGKKVRDWSVILIEKNDGNWRPVKVIWIP